MRLLHFSSGGGLQLTRDFTDDIPIYAILSHTWGDDEDEVTYSDICSGSYRIRAGHTKIRFGGQQAGKDGLQYLWVDTCCINKANFTELSEAITSMFRWYRDAAKCYVYLSDVSIDDQDDNSPTERPWEAAFRQSRWFRRGWTLQELLAPKIVEFFSREGERLGDRVTLEQIIHEITKIPISALRGTPMAHFGIDEKMQWVAGRQTRKIEDKAYCLLGIFDVFMYLNYGEGDNAFLRLRRAILRTLRDSPNCQIPFSLRGISVVDGARNDCQPSIHFLTGLETTLTNLVAAGDTLPQNPATREILQQTKNIVKALPLLLEDVRTFEGSLGANARGSRAGQAGSRSRCSFPPGRAGETPENRNSVPLLPMGANIGLQILKLIQNMQTELPASIHAMFPAGDEATFLTRLKRELEPLSRAIEAQASASTQIVQSLATNQASQLNVLQVLRSSLTENMATSRAQMRLLQASVEGTSLFLTQVKDGAGTVIQSPATTRQLLSPRKRITRSLQMLSHALRELLLAFLELLWPLMLFFFHKLRAAERHMSRLLISDSIIFEDALGRTRYLPFEFFQHWEVFLPYLHKSFDQVPGLYNINRRRYHLVNSRTGSIIDPQLWSAQVKPNARLSMAMVVFKISGNERACPHCGGKQRWAQANTFASCSTCDGHFRHFEPGERRFITPSDGHYGGLYRRREVLDAVLDARRALYKPEWPTLTFPAITGTSTHVEEISENVAPVQNLRVFKKVDVLLVNDPERTVAILEELVDLVRTRDRFGEFLKSDAEIGLRRFIRLVRFEVRQNINFFDFRPWNMHACGVAIDTLQEWLDRHALSSDRPAGIRLNWTWVDKAFLDFAPSLRQTVFNNGTVACPTLALMVKPMTGRILMFRVEFQTTVEEVMDMITQIEGLPPSLQCLIYRGKRLEVDRCMADYQISTEYYLHLVLPYRANGGYYYDGPLPSWMLLGGDEEPSTRGSVRIADAVISDQQSEYMGKIDLANGTHAGQRPPSGMFDLDAFPPRPISPIRRDSWGEWVAHDGFYTADGLQESQTPPHHQFVRVVEHLDESTEMETVD
ncbi:uncharacterized protein PV07_05681 [Cladophialophora immunda]|uniref:Ubiquitin-like domain-containing protein n=1 Tax=Cladophialophora immunda TaxID=569365 RepID=A0A0D2CIA2_9EURO|nr:uncharacterized protein PV07_05681 [Cladophialophora immunda]KIW29895.1 hypothetical protein PV07_05681 [Cladophialophora immunda]